MILLAQHIVPIDRPPISWGGIEIRDGKIVRIGPRDSFPCESVTDLGQALLLPGLINAHAHLELSAYAGCLPPSGLWRWLTRLILLRRKATPEAEKLSARQAALDSLRRGVTCIADISRRGDTWSALRDLPIRKLCFAEVISTATGPPRNAVELAEALDAVPRDDRLYIGVSPHAPYTVRVRDFTETLDLARRRGLPLTTHWAETQQECRWLRDGKGILGAIVRGFTRSDPIAPPKCTPIEYADRLGLLAAGALLAHVNYITDAEIRCLARSTASVVFCPRSHRFFGHRNHRWLELLAEGINVCVGTDSAASLPPKATLSPLEDLHLIHEHRPDVPPETLFSMITLRSARALGLDAQMGSLTPGKLADLVAFPATSASCHETLAAILKDLPAPIGVWIGGVSCSVPPQG